MKTIAKKSEAQLTEKRSKFIGRAYYVTSAEEAENKIKEIRKQNNDARHHCFAYRIYDNGNIIDRFSDDGEPSGTAGAPMLNLLIKNELNNVLIIVTRYFGGILLGTGGLVRAYSETAKLAIEQAEVQIIELGFELKLYLPYQDLENFKYYCKKNRILISNIEFAENIICKIEVNNEEKEKILTEEIKTKFNIQKIEILMEKYIKK